MSGTKFKVIFLSGYHQYATADPTPLTFAQSEVSYLFSSSGWEREHFAIKDEKDYLTIINNLTQDTLVYYTGHGDGQDKHPNLSPTDEQSFDPLPVREKLGVKLSFILDCCNCYSQVHLGNPKKKGANGVYDLSFLDPSQEFLFSLRPGNSSIVYNGMSTIFGTSFVMACLTPKIKSIENFSTVFELILYSAYKTGNLLEDTTQRTILHLDDKLIQKREKRGICIQIKDCFLKVPDKFPKDLQDEVEQKQNNLPKKAHFFPTKMGKITLDVVQIEEYCQSEIEKFNTEQ